LGAVAGAYSATVFIEIPIQDVVATVFDGPVAAVDGKELLGVCLVGLSAGDAVGYVSGLFSGFFLYRVSLDDKGLPDVREVEVGVEFGGGPDFSGFDPAMIRRVIGDEMRFLAILEVELNIFKDPWLIAFDGEVIIGFALQA